MSSCFEKKLFWMLVEIHARSEFAILSHVRRSLLDMFLGKGVLKICSKFAGEYSCRSAISIKLQSNAIEITLPHGCSPVNFGAYFQSTFFLRTPLDGCFCCIQDWEMEKSVDSSKTSTVLLTDLSKAFDGLPHDFIITKLNAYVFNLSSLRLIHSYL